MTFHDNRTPMKQLKLKIGGNLPSLFGQRCTVYYCIEVSRRFWAKYLQRM